MPDKYAILQLQETDETAWKRFMSLAYVRMHSRELEPNHYDLVYTGTLDPDWEHPLEELFVLFNAKAPADFTGRAMSTSDIVAVIGAHLSPTYFYCDCYGFKPLPTFHHPEVEKLGTEL